MKELEEIVIKTIEKIDKDNEVKKDVNNNTKTK